MHLRGKIQKSTYNPMYSYLRYWPLPLELSIEFCLFTSRDSSFNKSKWYSRTYLDLKDSFASANNASRLSKLRNFNDTGSAHEIIRQEIIFYCRAIFANLRQCAPKNSSNSLISNKYNSTEILPRETCQLCVGNLPTKFATKFEICVRNYEIENELRNRAVKSYLKSTIN